MFKSVVRCLILLAVCAFVVSTFGCTEKYTDGRSLPSFSGGKAKATFALFT